MRRFTVAATLAAGTLLILAAPALADGTIEWEGHGSENLQCEAGGHWVLAPAFGVESATLAVDGVEYEMTQHGDGSWSADSVGPIDSDVEASVAFVGEGDERNQLQLSHCAESPSPSPSESESPSPSVSESPSPSESESPSVTVGGATRGPSGPTEQRTAFTGGASVGLVALAVLLLLGGTAALRYGSRREAD